GLADVGNALLEEGEGGVQLEAIPLQRPNDGLEPGDALFERGYVTHTRLLPRRLRPRPDSSPTHPRRAAGRAAPAGSPPPAAGCARPPPGALQSPCAARRAARARP